MNKQRRFTVTEKKRENKNFIRALFLKKDAPRGEKEKQVSLKKRAQTRRKRKADSLKKKHSYAAKTKTAFARKTDFRRAKTVCFLAIGRLAEKRFFEKRALFRKKSFLAFLIAFW